MGEDGGGEYTPDMATAMEWIWGEGFMSPGGREEVAAIVDGLDIAGRRVLDIGAGLGGAELALIEDHGAREVVGTDIDAALLARARQLAEENGHGDRVGFEVVEEGPLPFADSAFDVVFSKDVIVHFVDKAGLYREIMRVLRPGAVLAVSDWLFDASRPLSREMTEWLGIGGLTFELETAGNIRPMLDEAGFIDISLRDRNAWYRDSIRDEVARTTGENFDRLVEIVGREAAEHRRETSARKRRVIDNGELRPTHIRARKPT
jgi:phosphoethanolamine N-methyltransferase